MAKQNFSVLGLSVRPGEKVQTKVSVPSSLVELPLTVLNGAGEGKTVVLTAGIHGCEYPPIWTAVTLANELNPADLAGQLVILPLMNPQGFWQRTPYIVPADKKNLNRVFPGKPDGTLSEKTAHFLLQGIIARADFYIDMHCGDQQEELMPYVYYPGNADEEIVRLSREAAFRVNVRYIVRSHATKGAYNEAARRMGVPAILIERGGLGRCRTPEVRAYRADILNLLRYLKLLPGEAKRAEDACEIEAKYIFAHKQGLWRSYVRAGDTVYRGDLLAELYDIFGRLIHQYTAKQDGVILYRWEALSVNKLDYLLAIGV